MRTGRWGKSCAATLEAAGKVIAVNAAMHRDAACNLSSLHFMMRQVA
jgi:hypothetical protein